MCEGNAIPNRLGRRLMKRVRAVRTGAMPGDLCEAVLEGERIAFERHRGRATVASMAGDRNRALVLDHVGLRLHHGPANGCAAGRRASACRQRHDEKADRSSHSRSLRPGFNRSGAPGAPVFWADAKASRTGNRGVGGIEQPRRNGDRLAPDIRRRRLAATRSARRALRQASRRRGELCRDRSGRTYADVPRGRDGSRGKRFQGHAARRVPAPALGAPPESSFQRPPPARPHDLPLGQRRGDTREGHRGPRSHRAPRSGRPHAGLQVQPGMGPQPDERARPGAVHVQASAVHPAPPLPVREASPGRHRRAPAVGHRPREAQGLASLLQGRLGQRHRAAIIRLHSSRATATACRSRSSPSSTQATPTASRPCAVWPSGS